MVMGMMELARSKQTALSPACFANTKGRMKMKFVKTANALLLLLAAIETKVGAGAGLRGSKQHPTNGLDCHILRIDVEVEGSWANNDDRPMFRCKTNEAGHQQLLH